jgi:hypothetical protein
MKEEKLNTYIQSMVFENTKRNKWNAGKATKWLNKNNLTPLKRVDKKKTKEGNLTFRYRINEPSIFKNFITKKTDKDISFIIGFLE